jgi:OFA family oxalate/formate antiporter-like MFS transporter
MQLRSRDFPIGSSAVFGRWTQLIAAIACMIAIANLQYAWTLYVPEIQKVHGWGRAEIQTTFTIFVIFQTWLTPVAGIFLDRFGPRIMVIAGGLCCGLSWYIDSLANSLTVFYIAGVLGGIGAGTVYVASANVAVKWFADRRGLASGLVGAGFGAGTALTIIPIANMIKSSGYQAAFFGSLLSSAALSFSLDSSCARRSPEKRPRRHLLCRAVATTRSAKLCACRCSMSCF